MREGRTHLGLVALAGCGLLLLVVAELAASGLPPAAPRAVAQTVQGDLFAPAVPQNRAEISLSFAPVVRRSAPAVVNIFAEKRVARRVSPFAGDPFFERFFGRGFGGALGPGMSRERVERSLGSGVIVSPAGLVVTNEHVIRGAEAVTVALADRREFTASVLLADDETDLAVLRLEEAEALPFLTFGDSDELEVGDLVLAIGNPFGVGQTVTSGIVSAQARSGAGGQTFLQTDAAINPGNSGGALVDMAGRLVGVNSAILTRSGGSNGVGFAIPASLAAQAVRQAEAGAMRFGRPYLGVLTQTVDAGIARSLGLSRPEGVIITRITPASPFRAMGLRAGAVLLAVDGEPVTDPAGLTFRLSALGIGARAEIRALADGRERVDLIDLAPPPDRPERDITEIQSGPLAGLVVANLNPALAEELIAELGPRSAGPVYDALERPGVLALGARGRASRSDIRLGDMIRAVNEQPVESVSALQRVLARTGRLRSVTLERAGRLLTLRRG